MSATTGPDEGIRQKIKGLINLRQTQKQKLITLLKQLADKLHEQHRQLNIAKTSFASGGVAGGIVSIVGFGLAPVTLGVSLIVSAVGGAIMVASGTGGLSSFIAEKVIIKKLWNQVEEELQKQFKIELDICGVIKAISIKGGGVAGGITGLTFKGLKLADLAGDVNGVIGGVGTAAKGVKTGTATAKTVTATLTTTFGRVAHYGGFAFTLVGMAFDIYTIVESSKKIHKDQPCDAETQLRQLIVKLESKGS